MKRGPLGHTRCDSRRSYAYLPLQTLLGQEHVNAVALAGTNGKGNHI